MQGKDTWKGRSSLVMDGDNILLFKNLLPVETFKDVFLSAVRILVPRISIDFQDWEILRFEFSLHQTQML